MSIAVDKKTFTYAGLKEYQQQVKNILRGIASAGDIPSKDASDFGELGGPTRLTLEGRGDMHLISEPAVPLTLRREGV